MPLIVEGRIPAKVISRYLHGLGQILCVHHEQAAPCVRIVVPQTGSILTAQGGEVLFRRVHLHDQRQTLGFQILNLAVHGGGNSVRAAACQLLIQDILHARQAQHMRHSLTLHLRQRPQSAE